MLKTDSVPCESITGSVVINGDKTIFIGTLDQAAKKLNIKVDCVPHRITHDVDFKLTTTKKRIITGHGDILGPINIKVTKNQNLMDIDIVAEYKNKNYAFVKLTGDGVTPTVMQGMVPSKVDYTMTYNIMESKMEGTTNNNLNLISMVRKIKIPKPATIPATTSFTCSPACKAGAALTRGRNTSRLALKGSPTSLRLNSKSKRIPVMAML